VAVPASEVARKPYTLDYVQAAAIPIAARTAWKSLFEVAQLAPDQTVLIHGATGGVGSMAVQLAKWRGTQVIGTASAYNLAFLCELGADTVIDYPTTRFKAGVCDLMLCSIASAAKRNNAHGRCSNQAGSWFR